MKKSINNYRKALTWGGAACLLLASWPAHQARGQGEQLLACQSPGVVVAEGGEVAPVGELKVRAYRLEESAVGRLCLSVTMDVSANGAFLIWVGDDPLAAYPLRRGELTASFPPEWLAQGAQVSVSRFDTPYELSTHPERLALPESLRRPHGVAPGERMKIKSLRRETREWAGGARRFVVIEVTKTTPFGRGTMNNAWVIQIGREEFHAHELTPKLLTSMMTEEEFAKLEDGAPVRVNWWAGALPLGHAGKSFARLDKSAVVGGN